MKVAIIGTWHVHTEEYTRAILENPKAEAVAVWDSDAARGKAFAQHVGLLPELLVGHRRILGRKRFYFIGRGFYFFYLSVTVGAEDLCKQGHGIFSPSYLYAIRTYGIDYTPSESKKTVLFVKMFAKRTGL